MVQTPPKSIVLADFLAMPETKPASEYIDGQILSKPMPQGQHSTIQGEWITTINALTKPNRIAGTFPELRCTFDGRSIVLDIAVFTWDRIPTHEDGTIANSFNAPPTGCLKFSAPINPS